MFELGEQPTAAYGPGKCEISLLVQLCNALMMVFDSLKNFSPFKKLCVSSHFLVDRDRSRVHGGVVVKALRYKPAGRGFNSRCCYWNFSVT